ncbi:hypothetical protein BGW37DRAFT_492237 [Umbelopsis sp. PMI_123]|nr:hypothetical protein BGW37DRAFT_492237 [Umbelopsis sp. PMI_123]
MDALKRFIPTTANDATNNKVRPRKSYSGHSLSQESEDGLLSYRYQPIKQRRRSFTVSTIPSSESSSVPYTIVEQKELTPPSIAFDMKQLDKALQTAYVLLSSCDSSSGHLPEKLKQSIVQKAQQDSRRMSDHVRSQSGKDESQPGIGTAQSVVHRLYSRSLVLDKTKTNSKSRYSLSTGDLQQAIRNGATQVQTYDKRLSNGSDMTDSSESCSSVTSEPSSPRTPNYNAMFVIVEEGDHGSILRASPGIKSLDDAINKDKIDVWDFPFTKAYTSSQLQPGTRARSSQEDSYDFTKRPTSYGLAELVHSVLGDAIKQADKELSWDESGNWESDDDEEPAMTEQEIRDYERERSLAMRRNPLNRYLSGAVSVLY